MTPVRAFIGLGSNLDGPVDHVRDALAALGRLPASRLANHSRLYASRPLGSAEQPEYVNAVAAVDTSLGPFDLLHELFAIENAHGRVRGPVRWGPRTLDLDLLLHGATVMRSDRLTLPHAGLYERNFVLVPLHEIAPELVLPDGVPVSEWVSRCSSEGLKPMS